ncbi:ribonuclease R [Sphingomonas sabuli]|uniref:Ribonuclease R n=1 Tax=Sphingomonas sabuli TaxID=2764186 RepID=A0A7G9L541_9SPHN|nr:ribonuclease R [Sphingomonas sabuli]QNM83740.1 ribonuclease R [Sphingomonas sabuli]
MAKPKSAALPTRQQILDFIATSDQPAGKREIARAFNLKGSDKIALKALLKQMGEDGEIESSRGKTLNKAGTVPKVTVLHIVDADEDGNIWAKPESWDASTPPPRLRVIERGKHGALGIGDRVLARTEERGKGHVAHPLKKLAKKAELVLGVLRRDGSRFWLTPVEKKERREFAVSDVGEGEAGDLVLCEVTGRGNTVSARVDAVLGDPFAPRSFSLIAIHKYELPYEFDDAVLDEAKKVAKLALGEREDLTNLPIVAIDPADARDHDDAIWAEADDDPDNAGGWKAIVAIADVSFYVRPDSALDRSARKRGNSVYFPDRVVPMLPEELSADICSLKQDQVRAAMACHLTIAKDGTIKQWRFARARIRVAANIAYEDAQAAIDGTAGRVAADIVEGALKPLWGCWRSLLAAREKRQPLELDLPERQVVLDEKGRITSVAARERLDAHRLVEDYMIAANVAAARALEAKKAPVMYRIHEPPSREKLEALKDYLDTFSIAFTLGQVIRPATFNAIIDKLGESDSRPDIMEQLLRTQMQARYGPERLGHFGLALATYGHFTSPIRRYADLLIHRALVSAYKLGEGGLPAADADKFDEIGEQISRLERRAMEAERETVDRYVAAYLADQVGQVVQCRITGVQPFGFFATVVDFGGDGIVPVSTIGDEYFRYDEKSQQLVGEDSGTSFRQGQKIRLKIVESNPVTGGLRFALPDGERPERQPDDRHDRMRRPKPLHKRGRPANIRHKGKRR